MNKYTFLTDPAPKGTEIAEGSGSAGKRFSLTIRADNGSTMLETDVDYMHQAFQTLIDWSIDETSQDACAVITGPNGFYTNHRINASRDFDCIESACAVQ
jgi:hypothetical protein